MLKSTSISQAQYKKAIALINQGQLIKAHPLLVHCLEKNPDHHDCYFLLGIINLDVGQIKKAIQLFNKAISISSCYHYYAYLAKSYAQIGHLHTAKITLKHVSYQHIHDALILDTIGVTYSMIGHHQCALPYFEKALTLDKSKANFFYNLGVSNKFLGDFSAAAKAFENALRLQNNHYPALFALSDMPHSEGGSERITRLSEHLQQTSNANALLSLSHSLAKEYERVGNYRLSMNALKQGKKAKLETINYNISHDEKLFKLVKSLSSQQVNTEQHSSETLTKAPIFIMGMPRSGTTLVDRILSNHDSISSAGELQEFGMTIKALTGTTSNTVLDEETLIAAYKLSPETIGRQYLQRTSAIREATPYFIDKLPFNFFYVDLIRKALPKAKIICLMRGALDTCIGNYRQLFNTNNPYFYYNYDLLTIGKFYSQFYHLAQHWQNSQYENFKIFNYEAIVSEPEKQAKALLSFCDIPWQANCSNISNNLSAVASASNVQVRDAIHSNYVGRWSHYQNETQALSTLLSSNNIPLSFSE